MPIYFIQNILKFYKNEVISENFSQNSHNLLKIFPSINFAKNVF